MPLGVFLVNPSLDLVGMDVFLKLDKKKKSVIMISRYYAKSQFLCPPSAMTPLKSNIFYLHLVLQ